MRRHNNSDTKYDIGAIVGCILIVIFLITAVNSCSASDWNNGICQNCEVRYELRGMSQGLKAYACPECGKEVRRY